MDTGLTDFLQEELTRVDPAPWPAMRQYLLVQALEHRVDRFRMNLTAVAELAQEMNSMMTKQEQRRALAKARKVFKQLRPLPLREKYEVIDILADIGRREILDDHRKQWAERRAAL